MAAEATFDVIEEGKAPVLALRGDWTVDTIASLDKALRDVSERLKGAAAVDVAGLGRIDTAGAYLIDRTLGGDADQPVRVVGDHDNAARLLQAARAAQKHIETPPDDELHGYKRFASGVGRAVAGIGDEIVGTISFFGETLVVIAKLLLNPKRIRWVSIVHAMETAGLNALPIVMLLSFFIGLVVAYLAARILGDYGVAVFTVEFTAFAVMREFAIVVTAVLLAGRTNSAFTAEIGSMKMRQEIDAMRVIGIDPMEALVAPRVLALLVMLPILAFAAVMAGLMGGLLATWATLGVSPSMFFGRIDEAVPEQHFWVGMLKAPVLAVVLAIVGCRNGLMVGDDVASLGRRTTTSVVQAIFLVILLDAMFALWFLEMGW